MKFFTLSLLFGLCLVATGCSESKDASNVAAGASSSALADYEAQVAADQKASDEAEKAAPAAQ